MLQLPFIASFTCAHVARACDLSLAVPPVQALVPSSVRVEAGEKVATLRVDNGCIPMSQATNMLDVELQWVRRTASGHTATSATASHTAMSRAR